MTCTHTHTHTHSTLVSFWPCAGDLIISYRSDAEDRGSGFYIWVTKDVGSVHACSQAQDVDFDIKEMPHSLYGCPVLTHDQLVAHVVRFSDEVMKNITRVGSDDPYLRAHLFMPPQPQCVSPCTS